MRESDKQTEVLAASALHVCVRDGKMTSVPAAVMEPSSLKAGASVEGKREKRKEGLPRGIMGKCSITGLNVGAHF